jgi:uncharacterized paraquat-inducible protein A
MKNIKLLLLTVTTIMSITLFAQNKSEQTKAVQDSVLVKKGEYYCPMHPDVKSSKASKCSRCGTPLNLSVKEQMKYAEMKLYSCPMHPEERSSKPGKCTKCGMAMKTKG